MYLLLINTNNLQIERLNNAHELLSDNTENILDETMILCLHNLQNIRIFSYNIRN